MAAVDTRTGYRLLGQISIHQINEHSIIRFVKQGSGKIQSRLKKDFEIYTHLSNYPSLEHLVEMKLQVLGLRYSEISVSISIVPCKATFAFFNEATRRTLREVF